MSVERIPPPSPSIEPLKANVFERMVGANCQLIPLFPYLHAGAIVPCGAVFRGAPGFEAGHFFHYNTEAEVVLAFGSQKAMMATGQVFATQPLHGVNSFLRAPQDPDAFLLLTVTQRQTETNEQAEAVIFRCRSCHADLVRCETSTKPEGPPEPGALPGFSTLAVSMDAVDRFTGDARSCPKCGEVAEAFPLAVWGWDRWLSQLQTANDARNALSAHVDANAPVHG